MDRWTGSELKALRRYHTQKIREQQAAQERGQM